MMVLIYKKFHEEQPLLKTFFLKNAYRVRYSQKKKLIFKFILRV